MVAFRKYTLLPLDDCLHALRPSVPHLTRFSLHRCLQWHGISRLPEVEGDKAKKQKFATYPIGLLPYRHYRGADGRRQAVYVCIRGSHLDVRLCRASSSRTRIIAKDFLDNLTKAVPYKIHPVLKELPIARALETDRTAAKPIPPLTDPDEHPRYLAAYSLRAVDRKARTRDPGSQTGDQPRRSRSGRPPFRTLTGRASTFGKRKFPTIQEAG
jgi:hypothetical protein